MTEAPLCPRCHAALPTPSGRGRPAVWCSQRCRRAAYEERRAARTGAIGLRVERVVQRVEKPVWCVEYRDRIVEKPAPPPSAAEAAAIVLSSPPACRIVLEGLTEAAARAHCPARTVPLCAPLPLRSWGPRRARAEPFSRDSLKPPPPGHCTAASTHPPWEPPNASWQRY